MGMGMVCKTSVSEIQMDFRDDFFALIWRENMYGNIFTVKGLG
jgi:hypothetical protein